MTDIRARDRIIRLQVYEEILRTQEAPTPAVLASHVNLPVDQVVDSLRRLGEGRALVLQPGGMRILMAQPFSTVPSGFEVETSRGTFWAPCAWDALAIPGMLGTGARIRSRCEDCGEEIRLEVRDGAIRSAGELVHFAVPAARWWDDIFFT